MVWLNDQSRKYEIMKYLGVLDLNSRMKQFTDVVQLSDLTTYTMGYSTYKVSNLIDIDLLTVPFIKNEHIIRVYGDIDSFIIDLNKVNTDVYIFIMGKIKSLYINNINNIKDLNILNVGELHYNVFCNVSGELETLSLCGTQQGLFVNGIVKNILLTDKLETISFEHKLENLILSNTDAPHYIDECLYNKTNYMYNSIGSIDTLVMNEIAYINQDKIFVNSNEEYDKIKKIIPVFLIQLVNGELMNKDEHLTVQEFNQLGDNLKIVMGKYIYLPYHNTKYNQLTDQTYPITKEEYKKMYDMLKQHLVAMV